MQILTKNEKIKYYGDRQQYIAKRREKSRTKLNVVTVLALFSVFICSILFYTWVHMQAVHIGYEISQVNKMESEYLEINKKLKTEIATLKAPLRIKDLAKNKLGLDAPKKDQVVIIK